MASQSTEKGDLPLTVAGLGMVTALGYDLATACAAARAGLSRARVLENYRMRSAVEGVEQPVLGHPAGILTRGFEGPSRLIRLLQGALADLSARCADFPWRERAHRFYLSFPDPRRLLTGTSLILDEAVRQARSQPPAEEEDRAEPADRAMALTRIFNKALALCEWPGDSTVAFTTTSGHAGGIEAIAAAARDLASGTVEAAIVLAVDSLLDEDTLNWLHTRGRLKCDGAPAGLQPGEGSAALLLTRVEGRPKSLPPGPELKSLALGAETQSLLAGESSTGVALAESLGGAWAQAQAKQAWILSDHNGEVYRANEWGHALVRLRAQAPAFASPAIWYPAASFGDTGAASALLALCLAARAFERNYAAAETAVIASASDGQGRGALALGPGMGSHG